MIDIRQMRYFVVLAETLHFGRAAERLHLSQPPLSRQIAALEKELGVRLLERHSRHATLTRAGRRFLDDAKAVLAAFDQACLNAQLAERGQLGELSIGFMMYATYTVIPGLVRRYVANYPMVHTTLREVVPGSLAADILAGRFDAGIMFDPGFIRGLQTSIILSEPLCVAVPADHPLALCPLIAARDLEGEPLIAAPVEVSTMLREAIVQYCRSGGFEPTIRLETQLQHTIVNLVAQGLGIALVPQGIRKVNVAGTIFRDLDNAPIVNHVVAWQPGNLNPALVPFLAECEKRF
ncbi:LysR substrate-binding domain-containing protein [Gluconacetobacter takamatsuzukensis]|uniref:LysR family transcriptional regulator n=1 Tax=Gluconacetobacter takamatsuzukensis TaxID=1286190 RepID=A0A7W4KAM4_9PROT|nr:LysR substrate-binding domain-containing protein [Gluconacetobacter takamatsuzukensis]MBB2203434.1 LysR family transcriptional regulator [Gluconacetobacter takamatsuzukensis]